MGLFGGDAPTADAEKTTLAGNGGDAPAGVVSQAAQTVESHRKRGRPPKTPGTAGAPNLAAAQSQATAELNKHLDALFSPENWEGIVAAPGNLMLALSGNELWDIPKTEIKAMAQTGSTAARYWMQTDPKYVALVLFLFSASTTYASRIVMHVKQKRKEKYDG